MDALKSSEPNTGIPEGYAAIPVSQSQQEVPLRVCVLVSQKADPVSGQLVLLRDLPDARVYLGCVADAASRVREWIELWVQNIEGLETSLAAYRENFSNLTLDAGWTRRAAAFQALDAGTMVTTGWETNNPRPIFLDLARGVAVHPTNSKTGAAWVLCKDDRRLEGAGLPPYSTSLARYLVESSDDTKAPLVPVSARALENESTRPFSEVFAGLSQFVPLNPQGGLMMARSFSPLPFEEYVELLGGKSWEGIQHGKRRLELNGAYQGLGDWGQAQQENSHLFLGSQGRVGRFLETYHLKVQLLTDALRQVRGYAAEEQLPFLDLGPESFRVALKQTGTGLPILWTEECSLVKPGAAFALPVAATEYRYFVRLPTAASSIYQPETPHSQRRAGGTAGGHFQGNGSVRVRKVNAVDQGRTVLEATLVAEDSPPISPNDLLWIRLPLPSGRVDLYGHLYAAEGLAKGEIRFRTVPQKLGPEIVKTLQAAEGQSFAQAPFEAVPLLSTPCDLYSFGVLAVRALLVNPQNDLPVALDEVLSLARRAASDTEADKPLVGRIAAALSAEPRLAEALGPHRLVQEAMEPAAAWQLLPPELWHHTLAAIVRLFPGVGPDSFCKDYGDAPPLALEAVFNKPLEEFEKLLVRSRSLIVIDWSANREVHAAIRDVTDRQSG